MAVFPSQFENQSFIVLKLVHENYLPYTSLQIH